MSTSALGRKPLNAKVTMGALLCLYALGIVLSVHAMLGLPKGTETGPLGDVYPMWTGVHFASTLTFAILALVQIVPAIRRRHQARATRPRPRSFTGQASPSGVLPRN